MESSAPVGNYPEHLRFGVNHPFCGLSEVPTLHTYEYNRKKCFRNKYPVEKLYDIEGNNVIYEERQKTQPRIYKGIETELGEAPWAVSIAASYKNKSSNESQTICTGALITFEWVVTASHCGTQFNSSGPYYDYMSRTNLNFYVFAGPFWLKSKEVRKVSMWIPHPFYKNPALIPGYETLTIWQMIVTYDIALIKLDRPFTLHESYRQKFLINTICLPTEDPTIYAPGPATFYGYGWTEDWFGEWFNYVNRHHRLLKGYVELNPYGGSCVDCYETSYENYWVVSKTCKVSLVSLLSSEI